MAEIKSNGVYLGDLITFLTNCQTMCNEIKTDFNATLTKLDADAGVTDVNYNALWAIAATALAIASQGSRGGIGNKGYHQGDMADFLSALATFGNEIKTNIAGLNAKLDLDATVADANYAATWDMATANLSVTKLVGTGISWGDFFPFLQNLVTFLNEAKANINGIQAKLDADGGVTDVDYAATNPIGTADLSLTV